MVWALVGRTSRTRATANGLAACRQPIRAFGALLKWRALEAMGNPSTRSARSGRQQMGSESRATLTPFTLTPFTLTPFTLTPLTLTPLTLTPASCSSGSVPRS